MGYSLTISDETSANIKSTIEYLKREWSEKSVQKFEDELIRCFDSIVANPESFLLIDAVHGIRKCKASKYGSAYYRIKEHEIQIITFFDHRRNPGGLKDILGRLMEP